MQLAEERRRVRGRKRKRKGEGGGDGERGKGIILEGRIASIAAGSKYNLRTLKKGN